METWEPRSYQMPAVNWLIDNSEAFVLGAGNFLDMGYGKTTICLEAFRQLKLAGKAKSMLVVGPVKPIEVSWPEQIEYWKNFRVFSYSLIRGTHFERLQAMKAPADIYLINYEMLDWLTSQQWKPCDVIAFDEIHKMKSWSSKRMRAIKPFLPLFKYRWGFCGTPMPNNYHDLFSEAYLLDLGSSLGHFVTQFEKKYFEPRRDFKSKWVVREDSIQEIDAKMAKLFYRIDAAEELKLPKLMVNKIWMELPTDLRPKYDELEKEYIVRVSGTILTAVSAGALSSKLRQFLSGNVYNKDKSVVHIHDLKIDYLKNLIENQNGQPLLVGYNWRHELASLRKAFPDAMFFEDYKKSADLQKAVKKFNSGSVAMAVGHPASVGMGLNLQHNCKDVCILSLDFNLGDFQQFIKRVARQGQKSDHVVLHLPLFKDTYDAIMPQSLFVKAETQNNFLDNVSAYNKLLGKRHERIIL